jgi:hypothetical protein
MIAEIRELATTAAPKGSNGPEDSRCDLEIVGVAALT